MLSAVKQAQLRREAAQLLDAVQKIDGFAERLAEIYVPAEARKRSLDEIRWTVQHGRLRDRSTAESERPEPPEQHENWTEVSALIEYESNLQDFASTYLFDAEWSARAVHEAIRVDPPVRIELPQPGPPTVAMVPRVLDLSAIVLQPGQYLSIETVECLIEILENALSTLRSTDFATPIDELTEQQRDIIAAALDRIGQPSGVPGADLRDRLVERRENIGAPDSGTVYRKRQAVWEDALVGVETKLRDGTQGGDAYRKARQRARRYLNAAVNGTMDATAPMYRSDAPGDMARRSNHEEAETKALSHAHLDDDRQSSPSNSPRIDTGGFRTDGGKSD